MLKFTKTSKCNQIIIKEGSGGACSKIVIATTSAEKTDLCPLVY